MKNLKEIVDGAKVKAAEIVNKSDTLPEFKELARRKPLRAFAAALAYEVVRLPHCGK